jgi:hypothetical protein
LTASGFAFFAASSQADVIIRGPFGGTIVVPSPADVRVGPGIMVGNPGPRYAPSAANGKTTTAEPPLYVPSAASGRTTTAEPPLYVPSAASGKTTAEPPIVSTSRPAVRPETESETLPPPKVLEPGMAKTPGVVVGPAPQPVAPVRPRDFAKTFKPGPEPGSYDVLFLHPVNKEPVKVHFDLPAGNPEVSYWGGSLVFDYGRHEVEIRFKLGGRVVVTQR